MYAPLTPLPFSPASRAEAHLYFPFPACAPFWKASGHYGRRRLYSADNTTELHIYRKLQFPVISPSLKSPGRVSSTLSDIAHDRDTEQPLHTNDPSAGSRSHRSRQRRGNIQLIRSEAKRS